MGMNRDNLIDVLNHIKDGSTRGSIGDNHAIMNVEKLLKLFPSNNLNSINYYGYEIPLDNCNTVSDIKKFIFNSDPTNRINWIKERTIEDLSKRELDLIQSDEVKECVLQLAKNIIFNNKILGHMTLAEFIECSDILKKYEESSIEEYLNFMRKGLEYSIDESGKDVCNQLMDYYTEQIQNKTIKLFDLPYTANYVFGYNADTFDDMPIIPYLVFKLRSMVFDASYQFFGNIYSAQELNKSVRTIIGSDRVESTLPEKDILAGYYLSNFSNVADKFKTISKFLNTHGGSDYTGKVDIPGCYLGDNTCDVEESSPGDIWKTKVLLTGLESNKKVSELEPRIIKRLMERPIWYITSNGICHTFSRTRYGWAQTKPDYYGTRLKWASDLLGEDSEMYAALVESNKDRDSLDETGYYTVGRAAVKLLG